ncbi:MAG: DNA polymerase III subunit delta [Longimicrobiales bacterium]
MKESNPLGLSDRDKGGAFFLFGDDAFRKEEAGRALAKWHLDPETRDFNFDPLRGSEVEVESLASVLATPPMMAEWRVVLLREVEGLAGSSRARDTLLAVAKKPPPGLALIMSATIPRESRAKFYRELKRASRSVEFPEVGANDVPAWLVEWTADSHGLEMTEEAARALGGAVGTDLGVLAKEVEKLASLVDPGAPITLAAVKSAVTNVPTQDRWEWMDLVGHREFEKALKGLPVLLTQGESGVYLTMGLATHLLRLGVARTGGKVELENSLPHHQKWLSNRLMQQAKRWSVSDLRSALRGLKTVDRVLKSTSLPEDHVLEAWLLGMMQREVEGRT